MKKLSILLAALMLVALMLPMSVFADGPKPITEIGAISISDKAPTIDGKIDASEGWSTKAVMDENSTGSFLAGNALTSTTDLYFAYSEDGLYFAVDMTDTGSAYTLRYYGPVTNEETGETENSWIYTKSYMDANAESYTNQGTPNIPKTNPDGTTVDGYLIPPEYNTIQWFDESEGAKHENAYWTNSCGNTVEYCTGEDGGDYAFDGDVFALSLDILSIFHQNNKLANADYAPQYNVGIFEGNTVQVASTRYNAANITDKCKGAGSINGNKLTFEVMIPWDIIVADSNSAAQTLGVSHTFTKDEIIAGSTSYAAVTLMDRFNDPEAGYVDDWQRNITVAKYCTDPAGAQVEGVLTSGDNIQAMGIQLVIGNGGSSNNGNGGSGNDETVVVTDANGNVVTDASGNAVTQKASTTTKAAGTNGGNKGGSSAGTFDAGIAVAVGALATSAIGVYFSKKKR